MAEIRLLRPSDLPTAMLLKDAAGWNQTVEDWERLLELQPDGCFALEHEGVVAATATVVLYGKDLAWIGMVLTSPAYRGRGFARLLMQRALEFAQSRSVARVGLDATDMGIHLYRQCGFEVDCLVERWERPPLAPAPATEVALWTPARDLDIVAFGADRTALLTALARVEAAALPGLGYAMGRPGSKAAYFGPCVARSLDAAEKLLCWFLSRHAQKPVCWDILADNRAAVELARRCGFHPVRNLSRMSKALGPVGVGAGGDPSAVFAIAGFEYG